jgi:adenine-specific DNA-methyltransferase
LGFKVFKLAESHFTQWSGTAERTPAAYKEQLRLIAEDPLRPGWTPTGLLWEVAVKEGYGLNSVIDPVGNTTATVWRVSDPEKGQHFLACLDDRLPADITRQLGLSKTDLFVVRDLALDDTLASNLALQCRLKVI